MKFLIKSLKVFANVWIIMLSFIMLITFSYTWVKSGYSVAQEMFSPFNIFNGVATVVALLPAIGALALAEKLQLKYSV